MNDTIESNRSQPFRWLAVTMVVIVVLIFLVSKQMQQVREFIRQSGWVGILVCIGLYGVLGASPIPSEPLTVLTATTYGPFTAMIVAASGNLFAALIEYFIGVKIGNAASFESKRENMPFSLGKFPVDSPLFLIGARMLPGYGNKFISIIGGVYRVPLWRYIWTTSFATLLGGAIFAYGGYKLSNLW